MERFQNHEAPLAHTLCSRNHMHLIDIMQRILATEMQIFPLNIAVFSR